VIWALATAFIVGWAAGIVSCILIGIWIDERVARYEGEA
jgi:hypothetical protein